MTTDAVAVVAPQAAALVPVSPEQSRIATMIQYGLEKGLDAASIRELGEMLKEARRYDAEMEFARDIATFQAQCPAIPRSDVVDYASSSGKRVHFNYASFETMMDKIRPLATSCGFSFTFSTEMQGALMIRTCVLRHRGGHTTSSAAPITTANSNPGMSEQQKFAAAETSASRRALAGVLGLTMTEVDAETEANADPTPITNEQEATLVALLAETKSDLERFKRFLGVTALKDLPAVRYAEAVRALEGKRKGGGR